MQTVPDEQVRQFVIALAQVSQFWVAGMKTYPESQTQLVPLKCIFKFVSHDRQLVPEEQFRQPGITEMQVAHWWLEVTKLP